MKAKSLLSKKPQPMPASVPVIVKDTGTYGLGVFAAKLISQGTHITTFSGKRITYDECVNRIKTGTLHPDDPFQIGRFEFIELDEQSRLFNHSCDPNAVIRNESDLCALRDISAGEEICYDYSTTVPPSVSNSEWLMSCKCGSANCRKLIGNVLTIPPERFTLYLNAHVGGAVFSLHAARTQQDDGDYLPAIVAVRPSKLILGEAGVFALRNLPTDTIIAKAEDWDESIMILWKDFRRLDKVTQSRLRMFCWQSKEGVHAPRDINQLSIPWHINHSCKPNVYMDAVGNYRTLRAVRNGAELFIDIGTIMTDPNYSLKCLCGEPNCVGTIRSRNPDGGGDDDLQLVKPGLRSPHVSVRQGSFRQGGPKCR